MPLSGVALKLVKIITSNDKPVTAPFDILPISRVASDIEEGIWDNIVPDRPLVRCEKTGNN